MNVRDRRKLWDDFCELVSELGTQPGYVLEKPHGTYLTFTVTPSVNRATRRRGKRRDFVIRFMEEECLIQIQKNETEFRQIKMDSGETAQSLFDRLRAFLPPF